MADPDRAATTVGRVVRFACFALAYAAAIVLGRATVVPGTELALFWPAAGVSAWWALGTVRGRELLLVGGAVGMLSMLGNAATGASLPTAAVFGLASVTTALSMRAVAVVILRRTQPSPGCSPTGTAERAARVRSVADVYRLLCAALVSSVAGAALGMVGLLLAGGAPSVESLLVWVVRSLAAVIGITLPALAVRSWSRGSTSRHTTAAEALALFLTTVALQWLVFGPDQPLPLVFLPFALLFWSGIRMPTPIAGLHGTALGCSTLALVSVGWGGPVRDIADAGVQALTVQAFMMLATALALLVSAAMCEREALLRTLRDSRRRAVEQAEHLDNARAKAERLLADAPHGVAVLDTHGRIRQANRALTDMVGRAPEDLVGLLLPDLSPPHAHVALGHLEEAGAAPGSLVGADWTIELDGRRVHVALSSRLLRSDKESEDIVLVNVVDVSERRHYEKRLAHLADHDALTGLFNRRRFEEAVRWHVELCGRYGRRGAMLLLDLDNFKEVNDTHGHGKGDELLVSVSLILSSSLRAGDVVARLGGDEFAVLLPESDREGAEAVAAHLVERVRKHSATLDGVGRRVTTSVGVITFDGAFEHDEDPMTLADMLMYDAKDAGRDQFAVLDDETFMTPRTGARLAWRNRMERALELDSGFELYLQPILDLSTNRVASAEALIRLVDHGAPVPASRFLYIAERAGLAPRIDEWVVRNAVPLLGRLRELDPEFQLEVNLSGHSIGDPRIEAAVVESLARHRVAPHALILEITETAAVADVPTARGFAERMTSIGTRFALDDFGAGFGSFYYLKHLVFDYVKIDGEFVAHAAGSHIDRTILRSIVGIARDLGKRTVAEFVGDDATLAVVREQQIDLVQGHLIGPAVPEDEFVLTHLGDARREHERAHRTSHMATAREVLA